ncbi:MAG: FUSC family protein [Solirubrobacteraceae bacterium]
MSEQRALAKLLRAAVRIDRAQLRAGTGLRHAFGVTAPLLAGIALGSPARGVALAGGALLAAFADIGGSYGARARTMLAASAAGGVASWVGMVCGGHDIALALLLGLWGFVVGLSVSLGRATSVVALMSALGLIVVADYPASPGTALLHALFGLTGGAFQALLALVLIPLRPAAPQRRAVAACCRLLAEAVAAPRDPAFSAALEDADRALQASRGVAGAGEPLGRALRGCLDILDRIYVELAAISLAAAQVEREAVLRAASDALRTAAQVLESARALEPGAAPLPPPARAGTREAALRGELRALLDVADAAALSRSAAAARLRPQLAGLWPNPGAALEIMRANLTMSSPAFRHAIRLSVALATAVLLARSSAFARGYWIPVTVLFVLKPDFATTFARGTQRYLGTAAGVVLSTLLARALAPDAYGLAALVFLFSGLAFALYYANYGLFSAAITSLIVFLISFEGLRPASVSLDRLVDTAIGGALALLLYALWPTWERGRSGEVFRALIGAERRYIAAVLSAAAAGGTGLAAIGAARRQVRLARTLAEASVERSRAEPLGARGNVERDVGLLSSTRRLGAAGLTLESHLHRSSGAVAELTPLTEAIDTALGALEGPRPGPEPELRALHREFADRRGEDIFVLETERMIDAIATIRTLLGQADREPRSAGSLGRLRGRLSG